jgi:hypothetical protein
VRGIDSLLLEQLHVDFGIDRPRSGAAASFGRDQRVLITNRWRG